jgi:tRNA A-37 threonylcarbamoyl transferase component Bud32
VRLLEFPRNPIKKARMDGRWTETVSPEETPRASIRLLSPGCEVGDRYEVSEVLGIGGSGVVYKAYDRELHRHVALKVLRHDRMSESALRRFRREVAIARDVHSPHLVRVFDLAQSGDSTYLIMELVEGESFAALIHRAPLSIDDAIHVARQILLALTELHRLGIVHRDVKPSNVMLGPDLHAKVTDFGLARRLESHTRATETQAVLGTYEYLSPEQALGREVDTRSDLYSFGILLYECLTGDVPLRGGSSLGTAIAHISKPAPDVRSRRPDVPRWLSALIAKLLEKNVAHRYASAAAVLDDLQRRRAPRKRIAYFGAGVIAIAAVVSVGGVVGFRWIDGNRFEKFVSDGIRGGSAVNKRGDILWTDPTLPARFAATEVVVTPGSAPLLAAIRYESTVRDQKRAHHLLLLDPQTREERGAIDLPDLSPLFPEFGRWTFPNRMMAVDLDHDGAQELVVSYSHQPYWPSYSIHVDPRRGVARPVLVASGHHAVLGAIDIDRDGVDELIFWGVSNRMGWYGALAAVKVELVPSGDGQPAIASTPDAVYTRTSSRALLWYTLVGERGFTPGTTYRIERARRTIVADFGDGTQTELGLDGFELRPEPEGLRRERQEAQARSYAALREAMELSRTNFGTEARTRASAAVAHADRTGNRPLQAWARRVELRVRIADGATLDQTQPLLEEVTRRASAPDVYWEAAREFHLRGDLETAVRLYREGMRLRATDLHGRLTWEFVEGIVFVLGELQQWDAARREFDLYANSHGEVPTAYRSWIAWRSTGRFSYQMNSHGQDTDPSRYLALESEAAQPDVPLESLLTRIREQRTYLSETYRWLALSLEAEVLARQGHAPHAVALARQAFDETRSRLRIDPAARAHFDVVALRYADIARKKGDPVEARNAMAALEEFRRNRKGA